MSPGNLAYAAVRAGRPLLPTWPTPGLASRGLHRCVSRRGWPELSAHGSPRGAPHVGQRTACTFGCVVFVLLLLVFSGHNNGQSGPTPKRKGTEHPCPRKKLSPLPLPRTLFAATGSPTARVAQPTNGAALGASKSPLPLFWTRAFCVRGRASGLPCVLQIHGRCNKCGGCAGAAKDILLSVCHHLRAAHCSRGAETVDIAAKIWWPLRWRYFSTVGY